MQGLWLLLGLLTFAAGWLMPGHYPPWVAFQQQWVASLGAALIGLAGLVGDKRWRWPSASLVMLALAAVPLVQGLAGHVVYRADAVMPALYMVGFALSIAAGAHLVRSDSTRWGESFMMTLLAAAVASTGLALMQWLNIGSLGPLLIDMPRGGRPFANLAQPNHLATLLCLGFAACLYLFERRTIGAAVTVLLATYLGFGLVMTQSRTGWMFVALVAAGWLAGRGRAQLRIGGAPIAVGILLFAFAVWAWAPLNRALLLPEPMTQVFSRLEGGPRLGIWRAMVEAVEASPWIGWGWNQVGTAQQAIASQHDAGQRMVQNAHCIVLDLFLWAGVPIGALVLALSLRWLWRQALACKDSASWCTLLAIGAIGLHALTEYPLDYAYFLLTLGLLIGILEGVVTIGRDWIAPRMSFGLALGLASVMLVWIGMEYLRIEDAHRQARFALARVGLDRAGYPVTPDVALLDASREYHRFWGLPIEPGMSADTLDAMRKASERNPIVPVMLQYALASGLNGRTAEAARVLRALCNTQPLTVCNEARKSWRVAQSQYPVLHSIPAP